MKLYKSLDFLPIWNFNKIQETQDLRYLYILEDYSNLPTHPTNDLKAIFDNMIAELPSMDLSLQSKYFKAVKARLEYIINLHSDNNNRYLQKCENSFFDYMNELDSSNKIVVHDEKKYKKASELYKHLKTIIIDFKVLVLARIEIFDYRTLESKKSKKASFFNEVFNIQKITGFNINVHKMSTMQYFELRDFAEKEVKQQNKANRKARKA